MAYRQKGQWSKSTTWSFLLGLIPISKPILSTASFISSKACPFLSVVRWVDGHSILNGSSFSNSNCYTRKLLDICSKTKIYNCQRLSSTSGYLRATCHQNSQEVQRFSGWPSPHSQTCIRNQAPARKCPEYRCWYIFFPCQKHFCCGKMWLMQISMHSADRLAALAINMHAPQLIRSFVVLHLIITT